MATLYSPKIVTSGLLLLVDAGNSKSYPGTGTVASDLVGGYSATLTNGVQYTQSFGGGFVLSGSHLNFGDVLDQVGSDMSGAIWMRLNIMSGSFCPIVDKLGTAGNFRFIVDSASMQPGFGVRDVASGYNQTFSGTPIALNTWYHMAYTLTSTNTLCLYVNGALRLRDTTSLTLTRGDTTTPLRVGYSANNSTYLIGQVSHFSLYNRILDQNEILQNYVATKGRFGL